MRIIVIYCAILILLEANCNPIEELEADGFSSITQDLVENVRVKRWGQSKKWFQTWPDQIVYYKVVCNDYTSGDLDLIKSALGEIENKTCVRFKRIDNDDTNHNYYIKLLCKPYQGCKSLLGYRGNHQILNLETKRTGVQNCIKYKHIQHEFLHALGFKHEHNSYSRDAYIRINYENVKPGKESYFELDKQRKFESYGCDYDVNSIMHVPSFRHSKNGLATIEPIDPQYNARTIGKARNISDCDVTRINNMYCNIANNTKSLCIEIILCIYVLVIHFYL